jgi:hypothetical protein
MAAATVSNALAVNYSFIDIVVIRADGVLNVPVP